MGIVSHVSFLPWDTEEVSLVCKDDGHRLTFNKALELLNKHRTKQCHLLPVTKADKFSRVSNQVSQCMNKAMADTIAKNHCILMSIVATVVFCGRQKSFPSRSSG